ncbi:tRNA (N(6)-L-threonylcarbamoyladenosine(37)-C(2))-methylthiotransferase MtaB [Desulfospira joergensenii]|uniref:tRNA (N(6)-L-threonylcarbamoyladenosine(37)-C(2))- methylthiotransferase MtaB n=1 Tax=Desulfospira joergensenii TaxID=53329 RepID=UPI0003B355D8|nr:tRNA (N(6)-L-threonylcarbamoyladenosine(37)-C(2))-methylthiotransferase MtaB [Desulfospira joergensenii]
MKKFYIETLGCKVNQYESDGIASCLVKKGWVRTNKDQPADLCIINTCAVTSRAGMQSRQAIRRIIRENPETRIIVTGCHAQTDPDLVHKIEGVHQVVCHRDKTGIPDLASDLIRKSDPEKEDSTLAFKPVDHTPANQFISFPEVVQGSMTRAYLKIQDGCNAFCTYCIVPYARGSSVSMPEQEVFRHLELLGDAGFREVILTGIHTGMYGRDLRPGISLSDLVEKIDRLRPVERVRLSSIEPMEMDDRLIDCAGDGRVLCDHFHIPLQSGDDDILKKMKRPYTSGHFSRVIRRIHSKLPFAGIGADILIGFPSETDEQFTNTFRLIKDLPISYLHIFPFSPRKGTPAYDFENPVDPEVIKERCRLMRALDRKKREAFIRDNMGRRLKGLVQHKEDRQSGRLKAVTSNYLTVSLDPALADKNQALKGKMVDLVLERCDKEFNLFGRITP